MLAAALALPGAVQAQSADESAAVGAATAMATDAYDALTGGGGDAERIATLSTVVEQHFAFDVWERFLLGDAAEQMSADEIAAFRELLPGFLARLYANNFGQGLSQPPEIGEARTVRRDVLVAAAIPRERGAPLPVEYRMRAFDGAPQVVDVMVAGASFLLLKRDEFNALLDRGGADELLGYMRDFVATPGA
ncbi:MAG: ABC transporter substrate-binding protein [Pseudomonadota bacterium]